MIASEASPSGNEYKKTKKDVINNLRQNQIVYVYFPYYINQFINNPELKLIYQKNEITIYELNNP